MSGEIMSGEIVRVLLADSISNVATEMLEAAGGFEVHDKTGISADDLVQEIKDYDVVIIRSRTRIDLGGLGSIGGPVPLAFRCPFIPSIDQANDRSPPVGHAIRHSTVRS